MYRNTLVRSGNKENNIKYLDPMWTMDIPGLVRVPFYDKDDKENAYIVYYSEIEQTYGLIKYALETGEKKWKSKIVNGGYGTPLVWKDIVVVLKGFCGIAAFDKNDGSLKWEFETHSRVRASLNIIDNLLTFSSAGAIYQLNEKGCQINKINSENTFFFGTISQCQNHLIAVGTKFDEETGSSKLYLYGFMNNGDCIYEVDLGESHIISSDTAGFVMYKNTILVNSTNKVFCIDANNGNIIWKSIVRGNAGRHISVTDGKYVFYTTINGIYGALLYEDGTELWEKNVNEGCIVAPPTILEENVYILADSYLLSLNKTTGNILQMFSIGHAPYSACSIWEDYLLVGGGEPPVNGLLRAFKINDFLRKKNIVGHFEFGNYIENDEMEIIINVDSEIKNVILDASELSTNDKILGVHNGEVITFNIPLKKNIVGGYYSLPLFLEYNNRQTIDSISVYMFTRKHLPIRHKVLQFNKDISQIDKFNSGSAIYQMIMAEYGKDIKQKDFREIIDYVKTKSKWQDADFQTWRLILKRVLSSPAKTLSEFIELEKKYESR